MHAKNGEDVKLSIIITKYFYGMSGNNAESTYLVDASYNESSLDSAELRYFATPLPT
jgi:hypothetical protein